jgi:hypothetical protein
MLIRRSHLGVAMAALLLSGCSSISNSADSIWSSLSGDDDDTAVSVKSSNEAGTVVPIPPSQAELNPQPTLNAPAGTISQSHLPPALGTGNFAAPSVTPGSPTGTYVGAQVVALRSALQRLQENINQQSAALQQLRQGMAQDASNYFSLVGTINSRLQVGTTPGNPELIAQWNQAQGALDRMSDDIARLNSLSNQAASDSSLAAYILESIKAAYGLQGAVDEDHRQLSLLESDVNRTVVLVDRLLNSLSDDIARQSSYVSNERSNLVTLSLAIKNGELFGQSLSNRAFANATATAAAPERGRALSSLAERRPLVVIRFDRPNVEYDQALYNAVRSALQRRPDASFDLVAVTPNAGSPAQVALHTDASKRNAQRVLRSLTDMGLPADRVSLSATTSASVQSNEVQIYVR